MLAAEMVPAGREVAQPPITNAAIIINESERARMVLLRKNPAEVETGGVTAW
jgi:hypothetical protein